LSTHAHARAQHTYTQGAAVGCGLPPLRGAGALPLAPAHAAFVHRFLTKGFSVAGQAATQPCNYPTLGTNLRNPVVRGRVAGGGATGALAAVALGDAHAALATDWLGSARIPAACMGQYVLVCTPGVFGQGALGGGPPEALEPAYAALGQGFGGGGGAAAAASSSSSSTTGAGDDSNALAAAGDAGSSASSSRRGASGSIEAAAIAASDLAIIRRAAECMALPGMSDLRGDLTQVVVAEDLFSLCEPEMEEGERGRRVWVRVALRSGCRVLQCWR
jgi:hypothetical protein